MENLSALMDSYNKFKVFFEKGQLVGVDIGLSSIKIAVMTEVKNNKFRLDKFGTYTLSEAAIIEDDIQKPDEIVQGIQKILSSKKISKKIACFGLGGPNTVTKRLQVPDGLQEEIEDNILWESEQYIPFGADDAEIDYSIIGKIEEEDIVDAIVGAAKVDVIENFAEIIKETGLFPKVIDLNVFSLINVIENIFADTIDDLCDDGAIIIDFGAQYTTVIVYKNAGPVLTKEIPIGGVLLTEDIQRMMGVSYEEAEDLKIHGDDNGNLPEEIIGILEGHIEKLMGELRKVLNFYIAAGSSEQVERCYVTGGSSRLPGIYESLSDMIDLEVEELNPFETIMTKGNWSEDELDEISYTGLIAMGLAMRKVK